MTNKQILAFTISLLILAALACSNTTPTPQPACTPPACGPDEALHCPGDCPGGCGTQCATPTPWATTPVPVTPPSPTPTPTVTPTPTLTPKDIGVHVVRQGETLFCLGRAYLVNPWSIATRNGLYSPNMVYPGQRLVIPDEKWNNIPLGLICLRQFAPPPTSVPAQGATPAPTAVPLSPCKALHTIQYGETLWSISRRYGGSPWTIAAINQIPNPNLILTGNMLCIP